MSKVNQKIIILFFLFLFLLIGGIPCQAQFSSTPFWNTGYLYSPSTPFSLYTSGNLFPSTQWSSPTFPGGSWYTTPSFLASNRMNTLAYPGQFTSLQSSSIFPSSGLSSGLYSGLFPSYNPGSYSTFTGSPFAGRQLPQYIQTSGYPDFNTINQIRMADTVSPYSPYNPFSPSPYSTYPSYYPVSQTPQVPQMVYSIEPNKGIYDEGEMVSLTFKVQNKGGAGAQINFATGKQFDVIVKDNNGGKVWQFSDGKVYTQATGALIINAGETKSFHAQWDQKNTAGTAMPIGSYTIQAFLTSTDTTYNQKATTHIGIRTLPTFTSCEELRDRLKELITPAPAPAETPVYMPPIGGIWGGYPIGGSFGGPSFGYGAGYKGVYSAMSSSNTGYSSGLYGYYSATPNYAQAETGTGTGAGGTQHSTTNTQVAGVDEADIVKNDAAYIYMIKGKTVRIVRSLEPGTMAELSKITFDNQNFSPSQLYVDGNILVVIGIEYEEQPFYYPDYPVGYKIEYYYPRSSSFTRVFIYNITNRANPALTRHVKFDARYQQSRKVDNNLYIIMSADPPYDLIQQGVSDVRQILPIYSDSVKHALNEGDPVCDCDDIAFFPGYTEPNYLIVAGFPIDNPGQDIERTLILGRSEKVYSSRENLYVASTSFINEDFPAPSWENPSIAIPDIYISASSTMLYKFALNNGTITYSGNAKVPGTILNQFSMDEYNAHFRIATTTDWPSSNNLYILDNVMKLTGYLEDIAQGERIKSVRFMGEKGYIVTFRTIDPFFVLSLADPTNPVILGELKIPGYSDYLHPYDETHIVGFGKEVVDNREQGVKISLFDVSDVAHPIELDKEVIGYIGTDSELLRDHKALLFSAPLHLMAFPITVTQHSGDYVYNYNYVFNGAYIYYIDQFGFTKRTEATHFNPGTFPTTNLPYNTGNDISRIIYIGSDYYTISENKIKAIDMQTYTENGTLNLQ